MVSRILTAFALGAALIATPTLAQEAPAAPAAPVAEKAPQATAAPAAEAKPLTYAVNSDPTVDRENILVLDLSNGGRVLIRLMPEWAPNHVERIKTLARQGFYNG